MARAKKKAVCKLVGEDGNAFAIMGRVRQALKKANRRDLVEPYTKAATGGNYGNLLRESVEFLEKADVEWE